MDYGNDPLLSTQYAAVHKMAGDALQPEYTGRLEALCNRQKWRNWTLEELRDKGITAEMLGASGVTWSALHAKHGTDALIRFGFTWPLMLQSGFTARHLRQLSMQQLKHLGVNAVRALECRPCVSDICALQLSAEDLSEMGWTRGLLCAIGLNMKSMVGFGYSLSAWKTYFDVDDYGAMGFTNYSVCATAGWHDADIRRALDAQAPPARAAPKPPSRQGSLQFI